MKGTEQFKETIGSYLGSRTKEGELFRAKYGTTERTIDGMITYMLNRVKQSRCCGLFDMEVFSMAVHAIGGLTLEIEKPVNCDVVVNRHIDLTEEERMEQKALALRRYQEEELRRLQVRHSKPRTSKSQGTKQPQPSLLNF